MQVVAIKIVWNFIEKIDWMPHRLYYKTIKLYPASRKKIQASIESAKVQVVMF